MRLNADWQAKYRQRAQQLLLQQDQQQQESKADGGAPFSVCVVGRSGVGKGSLINHLLRERAARVSYSQPDVEEHAFDFRGLFCIREIPGYDGRHDIAPPSHRRHFHRSSHGSSHSHSHSSGHSSHSKGGKLDLDKFVQAYRLFEEETKAIIFVVNNRITPEDEKLMELAADHRKFFCIVRTHADNLMQITESSLLKNQLEELEEQLRRDLSLINSLNVRVFILYIPFPECQATGVKLEGPDLQYVMRNIQSLHFPLLQAYLSEPKGLFDEIQIHGFVKEEVWNALERFHDVKKRHQALDFSQHLMAGTLLPIAGPAMLTFSKTLWYTLKACSDVGLIEDADDAMQKVNAEVNQHTLSTQIASKEGLVTAVHDTMVHIFGKIVFEIAIAEVVSTAAEATLSGALPLVGPVISAAHLPSRFKKIAEKLAVKACMLHELWIMQNITGLLGKA